MPRLTPEGERYIRRLSNLKQFRYPDGYKKKHRVLKISKLTGYSINTVKCVLYPEFKEKLNEVKKKYSSPPKYVRYKHLPKERNSRKKIGYAESDEMFDKLPDDLKFFVTATDEELEEYENNGFEVEEESEENKQPVYITFLNLI